MQTPVSFDSTVLGPSSGCYVRITFPKMEGGKVCKQSIGDEPADIVVTISYGNMTLSKRCEEGFLQL